jgi:hypothetical protein
MTTDFIAYSQAPAIPLARTGDLEKQRTPTASLNSMTLVQ